MSLRHWPSTTISDLRGAWTRLTNKDARPNRAFTARNVRFGPGFVRSRDGFSAAVTGVAGKVTSLYNWIGSSLNRLIYVVGGTTIRMRNIANGTDVVLYSENCRGVTVCEAGDKALIAGYTSAGAGSGQVRISLPLVGTGELDKAFSPPWSHAFSMADAGDGNCTAGTASFNYIIETRTGFTGKPGTNPVEFTVASGGRRVTGTMTVAIPTDAAFIHPIRTRTDNPDKWYFEPGASLAIPGGSSSWLISVSFNTSDESLEASAVEVTDNFDCLTQTSGGSGPISPHCVIQYGKRAVYLTPHLAYVSEPGDYQFITEALHTVELPGKRQMVTGFQYRQSLYILGPGWTYEVSDNGDSPVTWASPAEVSSGIGTPSIKGVCVRTAGDYAWVASVGGLYIFRGAYDRIPISYFNQDFWERINWAAPQSVEVIDDFVNHRVMVAAPLDSATEPSHILVWDYARGLTPTDVDFAYYDFSFATFSALGLVKNATTGDLNVWLGPSAAGSILKETDGAHNDNGSAFVANYRTGNLLTRTPRKVMRFGGLDVDVTGSGTLTINLMDKGQSMSDLAEDLQLQLSGDNPQLKVDMTAENFSLDFSTSSIDEYFELNGLTVYAKPWTTGR